MQAFAGILHYEHRSNRRGVMLLTIMMIVILLGMFVIPAILPQSTLEYNGISDSGVFAIFVFFTMMRASRKDTVFLISRPIARRNVWLGLMANLVLLTLGLAILRTAFALISYYAAIALTDIRPDIYQFAAERGYSAWETFTPSATLPTIWRGITDFISAGLFGYCYGCLLQRWKGWTIGLSIGLPVLGFVVFVLPVIYAFINDFNSVVEYGQAVLITSPNMLGKWIETVQAIVNWVQKYFDLLFWIAAAATIPISYLTMRTSRHTA
ncbi:hypothetical protein AGMMS49992_14190 [Clostridia bacterium]|nr:hypothetical protein AGMMS49992_14190 [Clostridia bacterium]